MRVLESSFLNQGRWTSVRKQKGETGRPRSKWSTRITKKITGKQTFQFVQRVQKETWTLRISCLSSCGVQKPIMLTLTLGFESSPRKLGMKWRILPWAGMSHFPRSAGAHHILDSPSRTLRTHIAWCQCTVHCSQTSGRKPEGINSPFEGVTTAAFFFCDNFKVNVWVIPSDCQKDFLAFHSVTLHSDCCLYDPLDPWDLCWKSMLMCNCGKVFTCLI